MFIAIQHVISLELISRVSGEDLRDFHINVQKLPYPTHVDDVALTVFPQIMPLLIVMSFTYTAINIVRAITVEKELQLKVSATFLMFYLNTTRCFIAILRKIDSLTFTKNTSWSLFTLHECTKM